MTPERLRELLAEVADGRVSATDAAEAVRRALPGVEHDAVARTLHLPARDPRRRGARGTVLVVAAGTSDLPVAEEAAVCAAALGNPVERLTDVGVAGLHRRLAEGSASRTPRWCSWWRGWRGRSPRWWADWWRTR